MKNGRWGTDDVGNRHWRRSAEYTETGGEGAYRKKIERRREIFFCRSKEPGLILEGGKGRYQIIFDGKT